MEGPTADGLNNGLYNGPTTAPVIASGIVVLADRDNYRVIGLDPATGDERWSYQADGRIITPPTLSQGRAVFGDRCGYVHCLDLKTGRLAWRFLAAPVERYMMAYGQIESTWPLHGCLPVVDGTVVASAGYHGETDGGVWAWGLDLATGDVKWSKALQRTPRQWQVAERNERAKTDVPVLTVRDVEGEFSVKNGSGFYQSIPLNIELPSSVGSVAQVAKVHLEASTGALATTPGSRFSYRERYPFLDMESEYRGGPHGSGGWRTQFGGLQIGDMRGGHMRIVMDEKTAYIARPHYDQQQRSFGLQIIRYDADNMPNEDGLKRISPHQSKQFAFFPGFYQMDSFIVAGDRGYAAAEGLTQRLHRNKSRLRRAYKGEAVDGSLLVFDRKSGKELERLTIESAVINNGLAVAEGQLYAACEDGVLRCYGQGMEPPR
jgi:outer membrane protein assembly factor BamB